MPLKAIDIIGREPWLIEHGALDQIIAIATRANEAPEAVATRLGRPLDNARTVEVHGDAAVIPVTGPIFRYANLFTEISGATSLEVLARDFQAALDAPEVKRIVLALDTPGGQATGIAEFAALVRDSKKPVCAYVGDLAASAGYWIASNCAEIVMSPTAMVGSIGVVSTYRPSKDDAVEVVSSHSPLKRATPDTEAGRAEAQRIVDHLADVFVRSVADARGTTVDDVLENFGRGSMLVGQHAVDAGMADRIGSLQSILAGSPASTKRGNSMSATQGPEITRAYLNEHHPDLVASIASEARADGVSAGAASERDRIKAVRAQSLPGHEALIEQLAFDGSTTGEQAAVKVLAAERAALAGQRTAIADGAAKPIPPAVPPAAVNGETKEDKPAAQAQSILSAHRKAGGAAAE